MIIRLFGAVQLLVVLLACHSASAQVYMEQVFVGRTDSGQWNFHAMDCSGEHCTAVGSFLANDGYILYAVRSDDEGRTWSVQTLPLPVEQSVDQPKLRTVDQIDSSNVVIAGDSGIVLRTFDAGRTWVRQQLPFPSDFSHATDIYAVRFRDSANGIAIGPAWLYFYTSNAGYTWNVKPTPALGAFDAAASGPAAAKIIRYGYGTIYYTNDNGDTWDSTAPLDPFTDTSFVPLPRAMKFLSPDTIIEAGSYPYGRPIRGYDPYIGRSTDGGRSWHEVYRESEGYPGTLLTVSDPIDGLVLAGGQPGSLVVSSDRGATWYKDTLWNTAMEDVSYIFGWPGGRFIGISQALSEFRSSIYAGNLHSSSVELKDYLRFSAEVYPNPASRDVTIRLATHETSISIVDMLGRELTRTAVDPTGTVRMSVARIPSGLYVIISSNGSQRNKISTLAIAH